MINFQLGEVLDQYRKQLEIDKVLYLAVKVIPKAQKTEFVEVLEDGEGEQVWKIKVAAVPEKGKANAELCAYLAKLFQVSKKSVVVTQGETSQRKIIKFMTI
jgi:uncharacterized protein (TIGR00251 family)